jgi:RNA polymerase sigma factor (sigma-70 family)
LPEDDRRFRPQGGGQAEVDVGKSFHDFGRDLFNYFRRCGIRREGAEDLTQETFLVLLSSIDRFDPRRGPLRLFLFGIARNVRRVWERKGRFAVETENEIPAGFTAARTPLEEVASVQSAVGQLPEDQRETILLREFHGFSYEEIATLQGVAIGTVRSRLARAREDLRGRLMTSRRAPTGRER